MAETCIEWTDHSINPLRARLRGLDADLQPVVNIGHYCEKVSPGCKNCYSSRTQCRFGMPSFQEQRNANVEHWLDVSKLEEVLRRRKPTKYFWCDMTDMFGEWVPNETIATCFAVMAATPQHTHQVLTKRPGRAAEWFKWVQSQQSGEGTLHARVTCYLSAMRPERAEALAAFKDKLRPPWPEGGKWPLPNVWLGTSVESQETADRRIPLLLGTPAAVRFISAEPLLGPLQLDVLRTGDFDSTNALTGEVSYAGRGNAVGHTAQRYRRGLDWVIVGGESGGGARPFDAWWAVELVRQCKAGGVACFVKQLGSKPLYPVSDSEASNYGERLPLNLKDRKGGDLSEWFEHLRVRQFPEVPRG